MVCKGTQEVLRSGSPNGQKLTRNSALLWQAQASLFCLVVSGAPRGRSWFMARLPCFVLLELKGQQGPCNPQ